MKKFNYYLSACVVFALIFAGCSKDENTAGADPDLSFVDLTFQTALNDLANRAAVNSVSKNHFGQIPDCSSEEPATAEIVFSYDGNQHEAELDILFDGSVYFTDYSEKLKIPVANNGFTVVTLEEFVVYDAGGEKIWIAPISSEQGQFDGYVDNPLPFDIEVRDGTKPYIPVEVLCYDRRMANEYGYVFFDLENTELIEFCIFGNFCPPSGRHYVAAYSVDVWAVNEQGVNQVQLYDDLTREVTENDAGELAADPLCVVLPDKLGEEDRYRIEIRILDGPNYDANDGELIRTTVLTDQEVRTFFDGDDNLEYFHFFEGCDETDTPPIFDDPRDNRMTYKTCVKGINDSGVIALAAVSIQGTSLDVTILATGMDTGMQHLQHIHGFAPGDNKDAVCPPDEADTNNDGTITLQEGIPFYGGVQLGLDMQGGDFPTPDALGNYIYQRTFTLTNQQKTSLTPLSDKVVVLHGITGNATLPVACGELEKIE